MKLNAEYFTSTSGQWVLLGCALLAGAGFVAWQHHRRQPVLLSTTTKAVLPPAMPHVFTREVARIPEPRPATPPTRVVETARNRETAANSPKTAPAKPTISPLTLFFIAPAPSKEDRPSAPYGRLIPCETVVTLESNRLDTPVIGLVTEDVWHDGRVVIPRWAEVHGRAALDRTRERIAAAGTWVIVWRTLDGDNGTELSVQGLALDRDTDPTTGKWGDQDGSAGLRGTVVKSQDDRELKLFAATFLGAATAALQDTRAAVGPLGETSVPAATVRNATLAGLGAVLREQAQQIRESIARDGFYLRVPSGKPFYLYLTETLDLGKARRLSANPVHP